MSLATHDRATHSRKAARRSPNTWLGGDPQIYSVRRSPPSSGKIDSVRFSETGRKGTPSISRQDMVVQRLNTVQATWSDRERAQRRLQAIRKQEELMMMLADAALEDEMRLAVADGEQPILPPEIEVLRN